MSFIPLLKSTELPKVVGNSQKVSTSNLLHFRAWPWFPVLTGFMLQRIAPRKHKALFCVLGSEKTQTTWHKAHVLSSPANSHMQSNMIWAFWNCSSCLACFSHLLTQRIYWKCLVAHSYTGDRSQFQRLQLEPARQLYTHVVCLPISNGTHCIF